MNREDIIRMFNEAGESAGWKPGLGNALVINYLKHFADLVVKAEREACARRAKIALLGGAKVISDCVVEAILAKSE